MSHENMNENIFQIKFSEEDLSVPINKTLNEFLSLCLIFIQELLLNKYNPNTIDKLGKSFAVLNIQFKEEKKHESEDNKKEEVRPRRLEDYFTSIIGLLIEYIENHDSVDTLNKIITHFQMIRKELIDKGEHMTYRISGENIKYIEVDENGKITIAPRIKDDEKILDILKKIKVKRKSPPDCAIPEDCREKHGDPPWPFIWICDSLCKLNQI